MCIIKITSHIDNVLPLTGRCPAGQKSEDEFADLSLVEPEFAALWLVEPDCARPIGRWQQNPPLLQLVLTLPITSPSHLIDDTNSFTSAFIWNTRKLQNLIISTWAVVTSISVVWSLIKVSKDHILQKPKPRIKMWRGKKLVEWFLGHPIQWHSHDKLKAGMWNTKGKVRIGQPTKSCKADTKTTWWWILYSDGDRHDLSKQLNSDCCY